MPDQITYTEHAPDVLAQAEGFIRNDQPFALITSLMIKGGSARDCGSLAVVTPEGDMFGYLSNGCIDRDLLLRAQETLRTGTKEFVQYGEGSKNFDLRLPCGGSLGVLIDPSPSRSQIMQACAQLRGRQLAEIAFTPPADAGIGTKTFIYEPKFRLYLAGRGAVFRSVVEASAATGFHVEAFSPDADDLETIAPFTASDPHMLTWSSGSDLLSEMDTYSGFLTLFHDHEWEIDLLKQALNTPARFIGCMGSSRTHATRLDTLRAMDIPEEQLARTRGPIGLVASLRDAKLIALSALAEIAATKPNATYDTTARPLSTSCKAS